MHPFVNQVNDGCLATNEGTTVPFIGVRAIFCQGGR